MLRRRFLSLLNALSEGTSCVRLLILVALSLVFCTACPREARNVRQVPNTARIKDDPALNGRLRSSIQLPTANVDDPKEIASRVKWSPISELDLKPGESHSFTLTATKHSTLFTRALWTGGAKPISLLIRKGDATIANGAAYRLPSDQGNVIAFGAVDAGELHIIVRNPSRQAIKVQVVWGLLEDQP